MDQKRENGRYGAYLLAFLRACHRTKKNGLAFVLFQHLLKLDRLLHRSRKAQRRSREIWLRPSSLEHTVGYPQAYNLVVEEDTARPWQNGAASRARRLGQAGWLQVPAVV